MTDITFPDSIKVIEQAAFGDCTALKSIAIPDSITAIQAFAFKRAISDVNGDGGITAEDALVILQYATGKITSF